MLYSKETNAYETKRNLETKVGIFLMLGIGVICTLIIFFGEVPDLFKPTYSLTVSFPTRAACSRAPTSIFPARSSAR